MCNNLPKWEAIWWVTVQDGIFNGVCPSFFTLCSLPLWLKKYSKNSINKHSRDQETDLKMKDKTENVSEENTGDSTHSNQDDPSNESKIDDQSEHEVFSCRACSFFFFVWCANEVGLLLFVLYTRTHKWLCDKPTVSLEHFAQVDKQNLSGINFVFRDLCFFFWFFWKVVFVCIRTYITKKKKICEWSISSCTFVGSEREWGRIVDVFFELSLLIVDLTWAILWSNFWFFLFFLCLVTMSIWNSKNHRVNHKSTNKKKKRRNKKNKAKRNGKKAANWWNANFLIIFSTSKWLLVFVVFVFCFFFWGDLVQSVFDNWKNTF